MTDEYLRAEDKGAEKLDKSVAWQRMALIAGGVMLAEITLLVVFVGIPSGETVGYLAGTHLFPYVIGSGIAMIRSGLRRWLPAIGIYLITYFGVNILATVGRMAG